MLTLKVEGGFTPSESLLVHLHLEASAGLTATDRRLRVTGRGKTLRVGLGWRPSLLVASSFTGTRRP